jgi:Glycosyl hydrolases family 2, TIM barrel domain/Glycosyl hydrolases family 2, sugar binding domain/Glycosyl hydrolases family 2
MRAKRVVLAFVGCMLGGAAAPAAETEIRYLSGHGKDDAVPWEFFCTAGRRSGEWTTIRVPSCWELEGFGTYNYGHDPQKATEQGRYRLSFEVPAAWKSRRVAIVFEGAMTDTEVQVNGASAGAVHQGGFVRFERDVTRLLRYGGSNLLEVTVSKASADDSVDFAERCADYWIFGGIYRPVYLRATPRESIARVAIDARADGVFRMEIHLDGVRRSDAVEAQIQTVDGSVVGPPLRASLRPGQTVAHLETRVPNPRAWSAESPALHQLTVTLSARGVEGHREQHRFGFRTVEVRPRDGVYLNGRKIRFQGVNRHSFWPESGRTTSPALSRSDVLLMKDMNMNAVRMSHYPPDAHFLDACDELGLYVLDELPGWQAPPYDTEVGKTILREMVARDLNHPSVLLWDNGDEGGWNPALDGEFAALDPQSRAVLHPGGGTADVLCEHYPDFATLRSRLSAGEIYLPTELLHGLYDGGLGSGLDDFWNLMIRSPRSAGAFLWAFVDEAVARTDRGGVLDAAGNLAPDGILGPHREKEGSYFTVKEIWSPIQVEPPRLDEAFDGRLAVENRYQFTDAARCAFQWKLVRFRGPWDARGGHDVVQEADATAPSIAPGEKGTLVLPLPAGWRENDALYLTARDEGGREIYTWTWMIRTPAQILAHLARREVREVHGRDAGDAIVLSARGVEVAISKALGTLASVRSGGRTISLSGGPVIVGKNVAGWLRELTHGPEGDAYAVRARFGGNLRQLAWRMEPSGWLRLDYRYWLADREGHADHDYHGLTFDYPEAQVTGLRWLGRGPYRVWKNRTKGTTFDVWEKGYNRTETGVSWDYPEFKGYHGGLYWAVIRNREKDFVVATETEGLFLRLFTPRFENAGSASAPFPPGGLSFLHAIPAIGMKFAAAGSLGPQSRREPAVGEFSGTVFFYFGDPPAGAETGGPGPNRRVHSARRR